MVRDIAEPIAEEFDPPVDLYGPERGKWEEFEPLLQQVFRQAMDVRRHGVPEHQSLDAGYALSIMEGCLSMEGRVREAINSKPEFNRWEILGSLEMTLRQVVQQVDRAKQFDLLQNPVDRYAEIGEMGDLLLGMLRGINVSSQGSELW